MPKALKAGTVRRKVSKVIAAKAAKVEAILDKSADMALVFARKQKAKGGTVPPAPAGHILPMGVLIAEGKPIAPAPQSAAKTLTEAKAKAAELSKVYDKSLNLMEIALDNWLRAQIVYEDLAGMKPVGQAMEAAKAPAPAPAPAPAVIPAPAPAPAKGKKARQ